MTTEEARQALMRAMVKAATEIGRLTKTQENRHGSYKYAGIDQFLEAVGPVLAENGLVPAINEIDAHTFERVNKDRSTLWERSRWSLSIYHVDGGRYGPHERTVDIPLTGGQTTGIAQSYVTKIFFRGAFSIPTGEPDADAIAPQQIERAVTRAKAPDITRQSKGEARDAYASLQAMLRACNTEVDLDNLWRSHKDAIKALPADWEASVIEEARECKQRIRQHNAQGEAS